MLSEQHKQWIRTLSEEHPEVVFVITPVFAYSVSGLGDDFSPREVYKFTSEQGGVLHYEHYISSPAATLSAF